MDGRDGRDGRDDMDGRGRAGGGRTQRGARAGLALLLAAVTLAGGALGSAVAADATMKKKVWTPPGDTIVKITGDAANGFGIHHYDGSEQFPPTNSEALAECGEHGTEVARVRCRTEVRTWYRDLKATKRAIAWANYSSRYLR
jgi:hypothetical protein